ncbi:MAG: acyl-CoA dehydrogenase [Myxococcota bacterium]
MVGAENEFSDWIGKTQSVESDLSPWPARAAAAMLDAHELRIEPGAPLPPLWHWFYFLATAPQARLSVDGHPERGGFMPPISLPRRMFAGARVAFHRPLVLGRTAQRTDTIRNVELKEGRSGNLAFVKVSYAFHQDEELCIEEEQDIVYREPGQPVPAPTVATIEPEPRAWSRQVVPDARLLFRFSALTFNAHRIHYDRDYANKEEGYPGLVVHGPLVAVLLADLVRRNEARALQTFRFRGKAPLFDLAPLHLIGRPRSAEVELEALGPDGATALTAAATLAE